MGFLTDEDRLVLGERFENELTSAVDVMLFTESPSLLYVPGMRTCESCKDTEELLTEVSALSDNFRLSIHDVKNETEMAERYAITATPTIAITPAGSQDAGVRFLGMPAGYEFASFLESLLSAADPDFRLQPESMDRLGGLDVEVDLKVFSTPT
ncbi:MAG: hypothetical protein ABR507_12290 [Actinomycetota bacterium]|nr:thioredoxin family protein [Actinomycetota bacterium]